MTASLSKERIEPLELLKRFNHNFLNPLMLSIAGRRYGPYSIVQHVGRRSGRTYSTPVVATRTAEGFMIPLPYSERADWCQNAMAAEDFVVVSGGAAYRVGRAEIVGAKEGSAAFSPVLRWLLNRASVGQYLRVKLITGRPMSRRSYDAIVSEHPVPVAAQVGAGAAALAVIAAVLGGVLRRRAKT